MCNTNFNMTTKLRAAVLCSENSSALKSLVELLPELPLTLELIITDKVDGDNVNLIKAYSTPLSGYDKSRYKNSLNFETSILNLLIDQKIDVLINLGWNHLLNCSVISRAFNYNFMYFISPLFEFQVTKNLTTQQCFEGKYLSTNIEIYLGELHEKLVKVCLPIYIYTETLPILTARLERTEKHILKAGIEIAYESYWNRQTN